MKQFSFTQFMCSILGTLVLLLTLFPVLNLLRSFLYHKTIESDVGPAIGITTSAFIFAGIMFLWSLVHAYHKRNEGVKISWPIWIFNAIIVTAIIVMMIISLPSK